MPGGEASPSTGRPGSRRCLLALGGVQLSAAALVQVRGLEVHFPIRRGLLRRQVGAIQAVDGVTFEVFRGETLGLVGESGSGKSTLGRAMLCLERPTGGGTTFQDSTLSTLSAGELRRTRRYMQMIFQDPHASLNPRLPVGRAIREPLDIHGIGDAKSRENRVGELLELVGMRPQIANRYPHEFSGGQLQRVGIARALATGPEFVVADEPISALDVSIQAQIVNLLGELKEELGLTYLFIAHDLSMVRHLSDRVAVMYLGRIVELGRADSVFARPLHPYTKALISAIPIPDPEREAQREKVPLEGDIPSPADPPSGCRFHPRCLKAKLICTEEEPILKDMGNDHEVACHLYS
jgi:oligopeptide transport system ATP-binding protein